MTAQITWYVARSTGLVAWSLLTASVLLGLVLSTKILGRRPRPNWTLDLHRFLGGLAAIFTVLHVAAIVADSYVDFDLTAALVPFASPWRPVAVAFGVVSLWLLAAIELTSLARARLPRPAWRAVHYSSFPLFVLATTHALSAGTDATSWLFALTLALGILTVAWLTAIRILDTAPQPAPIVGGP
jgi:DMSO/TMAO reductase YedYZ heme-binding membrane subunit